MVSAAAHRAAELQSFIAKDFETAGCKPGGFCLPSCRAPRENAGSPAASTARRFTATRLRLSSPAMNRCARVRHSPRPHSRCLAAALALAGCSTILDGGGVAPEATYAASPANIASLTDGDPATPERSAGPQHARHRAGTGRPAAGSAHPISTRRSRSIRNMRRPMPIAACCIARTTRLDLALRDYDTALSIDPSYAAAHLGRGLTYRQKGELRKALEDFNRAIAMQPNNAQGYYNRAMLYQSRAPAPIRDRGFCDRDPALAARGRPLSRARA